MNDMHSCSYFCDRPACIKAQRDELRAALAAQPAEPVGDVVVSCNEDGQIVAVTRQDDEGRILSVIAESAAPPAPAAVPPGYVLVPVEPTQAMISAMMTSEARDAEGPFPMLMDHLDYGGENKSHTVLKAAYRAMIAAAGDKP